jgi:hypothetical protein
VCRLAFALAHLPAIAFQVLLDELHATDHSTASTSTRLQPRLASHPTPRPGHGTPDRLPVCRLAFALAHLPAIAFQVLLDELHATDHSTASTSTRLQPRLASHPTPRPGHGTPDRLPVRRLAVALARLPAIAFPVLLDTGAVVASRPVSPIERTEDPAELPVIEHRHSTDHATARPIGCRCAVSPSPWPACRRSPPGAARRWRRRRFVAGFNDRENEDPEALPVIEHPEILTRPRHARSAAGVPSGLRPGSLAGDRLPGAAR